MKKTQQNTNITIRIDAKTKEAARKTLEEIGLDISSGVKLFLHQVVVTQSIPFEIRTVNGYTRAQEREMIAAAEEAKRDYKAGKIKAYESIDELHADLEKELSE